MWFKRHCGENDFQKSPVMHVYPKVGEVWVGNFWSIKVTRHQTSHKTSFWFDPCLSLESIAESNRSWRLSVSIIYLQWCVCNGDRDEKTSHHTFSRVWQILVVQILLISLASSSNLNFERSRICVGYFALCNDPLWLYGLVFWCVMDNKMQARFQHNGPLFQSTSKLLCIRPGMWGAQPGYITQTLPQDEEHSWLISGLLWR